MQPQKTWQNDLSKIVKEQETMPASWGQFYYVLKEFTETTIAEEVEKALKEERQFVLNVLDGIDVADYQMQNSGGGTQAIRFALQSRSLKELN